MGNRMNKGSAHRLQKIQADRLNRMKWSDGSSTVHYYYDPKDRYGIPICAIREGFSPIRNKPIYCVFWRGWGIANSLDLDELKKDVEQKHRIDTMKIFTQGGVK